MKYLIWLFLIVNLIVCCSQTNEQVETKTEDHAVVPKLLEKRVSPFDACEQLVIVTSPTANQVGGTLQKFIKKDKEWLKFGEKHPISLGRTGLAKGKGIIDDKILEGVSKQEGDGKSPAGIFRFGTAFGNASVASVSWVSMPYIQIDEATQCIEDGHSKYYNQIIDGKKVVADWKKNDFMLRKDDLYKWGLMVEHNTPASEMAGSCIFFHLWSGKGKPTAGCTAMSETKILELLHWIDEKKDPLLIQVTEKEYTQLQKKYNLPLF